MRTFSVPADFKTATIDGYRELNQRYDNAKVTETYGQATVGVLAGSGRAAGYLPVINLRALEAYVRYSAAAGLGFCYTFNASCLGNVEFTEGGMRRINKFLVRLWNIGIADITVALPQLVPLVRNSGCNFRIKASTIGQINCASKAAFYKKLGFHRIVIDEDITRDFRKIRQIRETFGDGVEMIVNSGCVKNCPYKMFHYNHESHASAPQDIREFYHYSCNRYSASDWMNPIKLNWVRPEDLGFYESVGVHDFKIQGRHAVYSGAPVRAVETYMKGQYSGDLYELLTLFSAARSSAKSRIDNAALAGFLNRFYEDPNHCTGDCQKCGYCERFAQASIGEERSREMLANTITKLEKTEPFATYWQRPWAMRMALRLGRKAIRPLRDLKRRCR
jgi:collagenase-like PrtC family protease